MILDRQNLFSMNQAITATAVSTDVIDLGPEMWAGNAGSDREIPVELTVTETFTSAGATTLQIELQSSVNEAFSVPIKHKLTDVIAKADLAVGKVLTKGIAIPPDVKRYVRLNYVVATGPFTAGKITAGVTSSRQTNR
jgi:hypothetical protein